MLTSVMHINRTSVPSRQEGEEQPHLSYARGVRLQQIEDFIGRVSVPSGRTVSMRQVAVGINMKPSSDVMDMLFDMVDAGTLKFEAFIYRKNMTTFRFSFTAEAYKAYCHRVYGGKV